MRTRRTLACFFLVSLLLLAAPALANVGHVGLEAEEDNRNALDDRGQFNCAQEAASRARGDARCDPYATDFAIFHGRPAEGVRILDTFIATAGVSKPEETVNNFLAEPADALSPLRDYNYGMNLHRATGGEVADVILPGQARLRAWYGQWNDLNPDSIITISADVPSAVDNRAPEGSPERQFRWNPDNEWAPIAGALLYSYIEPGSHPVATKSSRPDYFQPDVTLEYRGGAERGSTGNQFDYSIAGGGYILWLDGSLLQTVETMTISNAILRPSEDNRFPFTPKEDSLIDVDRYSALAPGDIPTLYEDTARDLVNEFGSPSVGSCPDQCRPGTGGVSQTPAAPYVGAALEPFVAPYPREWAEDSGSTGAGRKLAYEADYSGWIDLLPMTTVPANLASPRGMALVGRTGDEQAVAPGYLGFEVWTGVWKDLNRDGFVGDAGSNPYRDGTRPLPDDYLSSRAEFFGAYPVPADGSDERLIAFDVTIRPLGVWPAGGAFIANQSGTLQPHETCAVTSSEFPDCTRVKDSNEWSAAPQSSTVLRLRAGIDASYFGHYASLHHLLLPMGNRDTALEICTESVTLPATIDGLAAGEVLRDCDVIAPFTI